MLADDSPLRDFYSLTSSKVFDLDLFHKTLNDPSLPYAEFLATSQGNGWSSAASLTRGDLFSDIFLPLDPSPGFISPAVFDSTVYTYPASFCPLASKFRTLNCVSSISLTQLCHDSKYAVLTCVC